MCSSLNQAYLSVVRQPLVLATAIALGVPSLCLGQLSDAGRATLSATIEEARQTLSPERLPAYEETEVHVLEAIQAVEDHFRPITNDANFAKWMRYLATGALVQSIRSDDGDDVLLAHAQRTHGRLIGRSPGLELPALVTLRNRIENLIAAMRFQDPQKSMQFVDQQLQSLNERISTAEAIPTPEQTASLAAISRVIGESNQAPVVPAALREVFSRPNLVLTVSSSMVQQAAAQVVCRERPIDDCILGTRIIGNGTLQGTVTAQTLPSLGHATVQLTLLGNFHSRSVGYNGPVTLNTLGTGNVMSTRTLFLSEGGISLAPTLTSATLASRITSINHPLRLVRKIASKRAAQQKPQADAIANDKFRRRVGSEFDAQVNQAVSAAMTNDRQAAFSTARTTLLQLGVPEPSRTIGSTANSIFLEATQAAAGQLAAINAAPPLTAGGYDLAIQLHESMVDNVASRVLAGRTMTGEQLDQLMADAGRPRQPIDRPLPSDEEEREGAEKESATKDTDELGEPVNESFVIDFARFRPVIFEARDQSLKVGLRGTRFRQGERELRRPIEITAIYRPMQGPDGTTYLAREGEVGVDFPGGRRLTITQVALKRSIQRSFDDRFPPQLLDHTLALPVTLPIASMRGQTLRASSIDSHDGWLTVMAR